jgi:hypothetical protein
MAYVIYIPTLCWALMFKFVNLMFKKIVARAV